MTRFYQKRIEDSSKQTRYFISINRPTGQAEEIEISEETFLLLDDLQREHWRLEKTESRYTHHLEMIPEWNLPKTAQVQSPEQLMLEQLENKRLYAALKQLPAVQLRRFLLRYYFDLSTAKIAALDGCSARVVDRSISRAKENLKKLLEGGSEIPFFCPLL